MLLFANKSGTECMKLEYKASDFFNVTRHTAIGSDIITWWNVLRKNRFAVQLPFLPKVLFITVTAIINAPFQLFEKLWYDRKINQSRVERPVFILGHPRSGTTYLQYLLSRDPTFAYCSTYEGLVPHIFLLGGKPLQKALQVLMPSTRPQDNVKVSATLPVEEEFAMACISDTSWVHSLYFPQSLTKVFDDEVIFSSQDRGVVDHWKNRFHYFLKKISFKYKEKTLLLKSPANTGRLKEIVELFPDARFIHIHRDPYEVYQSCERLYEKILPILGLQKAQSGHVTEYIFYFYEKIYKKYLADKAQIPAHQLIEFSYHDFVTDPLSIMKRVYSQLGLGSFDDARPYLENEVTEAGNYQKNSYTTLDPRIKERINSQWGFAFDAFGYSRR
jgi:omega-hydroxy-beta-dihydromenaquinone-9 sulfotransferase